MDVLLLANMNWANVTRERAFSFISVVMYYEKKIIPSVCWLFSSVICQFWLGTAKVFKKTISAQNVPPDTRSVECSFYNTSQKFSLGFFSARLPILCYFSHSSNFSLQFIKIPSAFFCVVVIRNRRGSNNKGPSSNTTTARLFEMLLAFLSTFLCKCSFLSPREFFSAFRGFFTRFFSNLNFIR